MKKPKWGVAISGGVGVDWIYLTQSTWVGDQPYWTNSLGAQEFKTKKDAEAWLVGMSFRAASLQYAHVRKLP